MLVELQQKGMQGILSLHAAVLEVVHRDVM